MLLFAAECYYTEQRISASAGTSPRDYFGSTDTDHDMDLFMHVNKYDSPGVAHRPQILGQDFRGAQVACASRGAA